MGLPLHPSKVTVGPVGQQARLRRGVLGGRKFPTLLPSRSRSHAALLQTSSATRRSARRRSEPELPRPPPALSTPARTTSLSFLPVSPRTSRTAATGDTATGTRQKPYTLRNKASPARRPG